MIPMSESTVLLEEIHATLKLVGYKQMIAALRAQRQVRELKDPHITFVIMLVCQDYGVDFQQLLESTTHPSTQATYARAFIIHYLRTGFEVTWMDLRILFRRRSKFSLYKWGKTVQALKGHLAADREHCAKKMIFDEKVKQYIQQLKK